MSRQLEDTTNPAVRKVVDYLLENGQQFCANSVHNAAGVVLAYESAGTLRPFSKRVNRGLCEALMTMYSDPSCPKNNIVVTRGLIEAYHAAHGLPTADFGYADPDADAMEEEDYSDLMPDDSDETDPIGAPASPLAADDEAEPDVVGAIVDGGEDDVTLGGDDSIEPTTGYSERQNVILQNTEVGSEYDIESILKGMGLADTDRKDIVEEVKGLVEDGLFEVTARDPYNGTIDSIFRVA